MKDEDKEAMLDKARVFSGKISNTFLDMIEAQGKIAIESDLPELLAMRLASGLTVRCGIIGLRNCFKDREQFKVEVQKIVDDCVKEALDG